MHSFVLSVLSLSLPLVVQCTTYTLATSYEGSTFFNGWSFSTAPDKNYGYVSFQSQAVATSQKLAYTNDAGNAIIKIDNTTVGNVNDTTFGRASVFMTSNAAVNPGSLVLFDAVHIPYGVSHPHCSAPASDSCTMPVQCSVWPAFFLMGNDWPNNGEIDIVENVNLATSAQYSLHTLNGCTHPSSSSGESGTLVSTDCYNATNGNQGCIVRESQANSFGSGFSSVGGGGFATLFSESGISTWFFPRASIPSDFTSSSPNPSNWGLPSAYYPSSACNVTQFFGPQSIIIDIDICGAWAGVASVYNSGGCTGNCVDLLKNPTNYDTAYFEIKSLKVFTENTSNGSVTAPIPSQSGTTTASPSSTNKSSAMSTPWKMIGGLAWGSLFSHWLHRTSTLPPEVS
ncbi:glycoside hydrolase family 16 protein [Hydnum rufescens UP504]|uniref:Glycoside hydrolase family 16 protein n=1 Tax=Hydnum rufescens UP504 TaxID=1448309 RepID=A0A9P6AST0_9AGAM|nr:glycoside hydrolase family 16 protein [Hydnum rufescens UP504]